MADTKKGKGRPHTPLVEWMVAAAGAAMIITVITFLLYRAVHEPHTPAEIRVDTQAVRTTGGGFLVPFVAYNDGEESAAHVVVEGRLRDGNGDDRAQATLDYVPAHSIARGGLYFRKDPRSSTLEVRALGYARP